ncbi:RES family NAD+ phosphorylase [Sulfurovum sp. TSL1]|uniref:RES family NAD+ phosphorylase n=1 Tax=Sulfurovum sp. TSL1 TaxID=2826994 RepID=UPI001CC40D36|nr:RES family NAD+ phosphorylase [Sulfurovum sp. TSL1]
MSDVIIQQSETIGTCEFCKSQNVSLIDASLLNDYFQPIFDLYEEVESGNTIIEVINNDWKLFTHMDDAIALLLVESILEIKIYKNFQARENGDTTKISNWQEFKKELKHYNRYFPLKAPNKEHLEGLLTNLIISNEYIPKYLYRSRVNEDIEEIPLKEMGKPPERYSSAGRANPIGIPYLYTASNTKTAIAEIRPHKGDKITVAKFEVKGNLNLADLRDPRETISPFTFDDDGLNQMFKDLDYLCHLGEELSKPILPREAHLEYLSSQYLCEFIKHCGFDGVIYKSSVGDGDNYAIFKDDDLEPIETKTYSVDEVQITSNQYQTEN